MSFPLEAAVSRAGLNASRPHLTAFLDRIHARGAYQRASGNAAGLIRFKVPAEVCVLSLNKIS